MSANSDDDEAPPMPGGAVDGVVNTRVGDGDDHVLPLSPAYHEFLLRLRRSGVPFTETRNDAARVPLSARMHNRSACVPYLVVEPACEQGVRDALQHLSDLRLYDDGSMPVSVRSGGHGYFNGASCDGIMLNVAGLHDGVVEGHTMRVQPGATLARTIHRLAQAGKALPHGDCFEVAAGGHFTTAGWDAILSRRFGLGCQRVVGGRLVRWDGTLLEVDDATYPDLLWALRGGAAAGVGVVTELTLSLVDAPDRVCWQIVPLAESGLEVCIAHDLLRRALDLPTSISLLLRLAFEPDVDEPSLTMVVCSLDDPAATQRALTDHLGPEVGAVLAGAGGMTQGTLMDVRLFSASDALRGNPDLLGTATPEGMKTDPLRFWNAAVVQREMGSSFLATVSGWTNPCGSSSMLRELYDEFRRWQGDAFRSRMYLITTIGGGAMLSNPQACAMPLGHILTRFEIHWDSSEGGEDSVHCRGIANSVHRIMHRFEDQTVGRPYRGDIWRPEQAMDEGLELVRRKYDTRKQQSTPL